MILSTKEILNRIFEPTLEKRLVVSPILTKGQISDSTIDLRIGNEFLIPKRNDAAIFDPLESEDMRAGLLRAEKQYLPIGERFFLHPNKVVLAGTIEYLSLPIDLCARVQSRSSYERLGLHITTLANPGYSGALTLTLVNTGNTPIVLYPGLRVAQLTLFTIDSGHVDSGSYDGKYHFEIGPMYSRAHIDPDIEIIKKWTQK